MSIFAIIKDLRFQDILDIILLTVVAYYLYLWFRGTKALKALVGLLALGIVFTAARTWGLFLTTWVFQILWQVLVIILIILFQSEIRQVLERVNPLQAFGLRKRPVTSKWIEAFSKAVFELAHGKIGSLIIIERLDRVDEWITGGQQIEGDASPELLMSIFQKDSPLHDGAMVIRNGQINQVACYLPLSSAEGLPPEWGTRHRAALGLTERCDASVVVVSEERGEASYAHQKKVTHAENPEKLTRLISESLQLITAEKAPWSARFRDLIVDRWHVKLGTLALVIVFWLMLAGQQNFERTLRVPLEIVNLPNRMEILDPINPKIHIRVRGLRKDASTLNEVDVRAEIDLSLAGLGRTIFTIAREQIKLPSDRLHVVQIEPSQMKFNFKQNP